ncbi:MAG: hypothetical protein P8Q93_05950 [Ascidiaceihabitans sp.]|nr:hypothetical protein [Ascidiaceihabitans sp.]
MVATAGVAAADVSLSGAANVGILDNGTAAAFMYNNVSITAAMSGETDGGLTFGASLTVRNGNDVDLDVGDLNKAANVTGAALSATSLGNIYVSGGFGKLTFDHNGIDNVMDDGSESHDVKYEGTFGALSVAATAAVSSATAPTALGDDWSLSLGYAVSGVTLTLKTDDSGEADVTAAYALNDMVTATLNYDTDGQTSGAETTVTVAYANDGLSAALSLYDDKADAWKLALGYTANGFSVNAAITDGGSEDLSASYDLGGGMSINAATNESGAWFIGSKMTF